MKISIIMLMMIILSIRIVAQVNLVPNPSFDIIDTCGYMNLMSGFVNQNVLPWVSPQGSPDVYNTCSVTYNWSIPNNQFGFQYAHSGSGYAGAIFYNVSYDREIIEVELDSTLEAGVVYCVGFYVSLSNGIYLGCNNISLYFSNTYSSVPTGLNSQIRQATAVTDTAGWTYIHGNYIATGGERYIIIGNFYSNNDTDTVHLSGTTEDAAYYYIDDVDVHRGTCSTEVNDLEKNLQINVYPNPFASTFTVVAEGKIKKLKVMNMLGQKIYSAELNDSQITIDLSGEIKGVYFIEITDINNNSINRKIIKQ